MYLYMIEKAHLHIEDFANMTTSCLFFKPVATSVTRCVNHITQSH